jgi:asparagine synthase (glutamine-hydrolysing)
MCGIAGGVNFDNVHGLLKHQTKRGPDNTQVWGDGSSIQLGHNRLSILDLSEKGNQPMTYGQHHLTYNGEIYNYRELLNQVNSVQAYDDSGTGGIFGNDAVALLHYIAEFGIERALQSANGMYAYCYFDAKNRQIHLVVDRFGQKPLYYYHSGATFVFASSIGALLQIKDKWDFDEEGLQSYWLLGSTMGDKTLFKGINRLTGSHHLTYEIHKNQVSIERYWTPQFIENTSGIEDLILDAINLVRVSDVPIYTFLSGGIDSTLVASQFRGGNAVHLGEKEWEYAKLAADKFGMNLIQVNPDDSNIEESLKDYAFQVGEPSMAALIPYITAKEVSKFAKVAISANGADELFFGYDRTVGEFPTEKQRQHIFRDQFFLPCSSHDYWTGNTSRKFELDTYVQYDLNKTLDGASMCHSLEVRSPFLDHRLVEMALSIPEGKHWSPILGRKAILKNMLKKMGFAHDFLVRPKLGFSLHREPEGMEDLKTKAWKFVKENGFLKCDDSKLSGRDERYLKMAALSFYYWYEVWKTKL